MYVFSCPLRLCSFSFPMFLCSLFTNITLWQGFHQLHKVFLVDRFTALSIFTSLGLYCGIAVVSSRLQEEAAHQSRSHFIHVTFSGSCSAASLQPGPLWAGLSAEEVMLLCVWL